MTHLVVGTAGHIDHGKSTLVEALTGVDPDRLAEEKARGITIDLGFARYRQGDTELAFVDVPGHERFVRNMLAGASGIDCVLLVIAADESVMPQTREHFDICRLLEVAGGVVAITKADLVDDETIELVRLETRDLVAGSFLADAPMVPVSARTGAGLDDLRGRLAALAAAAAGRPDAGIPRLPIDRAFSMKGFGTVVTGTQVSGVIARDRELVLMPAGRRVKVRGVQVHGEAQPASRAGQRAAVNLAGVAVDDLRRGDTLTSAGSLGATRRLDSRVTLLDGARPLKYGARVRFHQGTIEVMARVAIGGARPARAQAAGDRPEAARAEGAAADADGAAAAGRAGAAETAGAAPAAAAWAGAAGPGADVTASPDADAAGGGAPAAGPGVIAPGGSAFARLHLERPAALTRGDRFVLRAYSPPITIGGGVVLDPAPPRGRLRSAAGLRRLRRLDRLDDRPAAAAVMVEETRGVGVTRAALAPRLGCARADVDRAAAALVASGAAVAVGSRLVAARDVAAAADALLAAVAAHHRAHPLDPGLPREAARGRLGRGVGADVFDQVAHALAAEGRLAEGRHLALATHRIVLTDDEARVKRELAAAVRDGGLAPPDLSRWAEAQGVEPALVDRMIALLVRDGTLDRLGALLFHRTVLDRLRADVAALKTAGGGDPVRIDVAWFKARFGITRKFAIPLLEYLDRTRVTRRSGPDRIVV